MASAMCAAAIPLVAMDYTSDRAKHEMSDDRLRWHFENWAVWQRMDGIETGYMRHASGGIGVSHGSDRIARLENEADARCARAVEALLEGLPVAQRCAVHHFQLQAVFRFRGDAVALYALAGECVRRGLTKRGIY